MEIYRVVVPFRKFSTLRSTQKGGKNLAIIYSIDYQYKPWVLRP